MENKENEEEETKTFGQILEEQYGKLGTPKRDKFEKKLKDSFTEQGDNTWIVEVE